MKNLFFGLAEYRSRLLHAPMRGIRIVKAQRDRRSAPSAPLVFVGLFAVGLGLNGVLPHAEFAGTARAIGWGMAIVGFVGVGLPGIVALRRAGTSPNPNRPTTVLVVTGSYRFTRNPLYLSMALIYAGVALAASFLGALVLLPIAMVIVDRNAMLEEAYLERRFGDAYRAYKARVRRWV